MPYRCAYWWRQFNLTDPMLLTFRILSYRNLPVPSAPSVRLGLAGGTIGRATENDLVLDDPSKYISRVHARIAARGDVFMLEDLGSNPSIVNDRPLGKGNQVTLAHADRVSIGDYQMQILIEAAPVVASLAAAPVNNAALPLFEPPPPPTPVQLPPLDLGAPVMVSPPAPQASGLGDLLAGASLLDVTPGQDPFGGDDPLGLNLLGSPPKAPAHAADSDHVSPELAAFSRAAPAPFVPAPAVPVSSGGFSIPADYDPLADFFAAPVVPPAPVAPVAAVNDDVTTYIPQPTPIAPVAPPAPSPVPAAPAPAPAPALAPAPAAPPATIAGDDAVLQALLRGLGLPDLQLQRPAVEVAELVGALLREATAGTMDVLMARAMTKKESRIDMTMLSVRANNPLKFFPHAEGALTQMLTGAMAGYMAPQDAMAGAFDDLRAHELAVIAGMRAALGAVLHRFDPAQIESRLAVPSVMDKMLASNRKAKMWDRLVELYGEIAREADDDLQRLFGEKFSEAYEDQVARLRRAKQ
jgi:type VI secretion system FHA domain protein